MSTSKNLIKFATALLCLAFNNSYAQQKQNNLYSAGHAGAFIGGLYDVYFPYSEVLQHGDFGLGAPELLDGELMIFKGVPYKTQYTGKTTAIKSGTTPYAIACFFKAGKTIKPGRTLNKETLFKYIDSVTANTNGLYAIHVSGKFGYIRTRAFPPVEKPYRPLSELLSNQRFFEFREIKGDLIGFRVPDYMEGPFIKGYHFHFLSDAKDAGGHIIDLIANDVTIEINELTGYTMDLPQTESFKNFDFKKDMKEAVKSVENGKKD
ncbi:acetolactate decarboxylase [Mucilaginibacter limnophilus]|uniref:Alpha-acetolactate decarboxylase n=1 Tax=Mucilaginibacter limnophilus TaxID=1932778 RepID=A0A437MQE2_9SPHI|nr:acetolactate decarboxylase [Mucilaginibacter limnophilus]RVT99847.1 acetolactate decarboxylase [Mucilaginibacter limnophilus]